MTNGQGQGGAEPPGDDETLDLDGGTGGTATAEAVPAEVTPGGGGTVVHEDHRDHEDNEAVFQVSGDMAILDAGLAAGIDMDYGCRVGVCGACALEIVTGIENACAPDPIEQDALSRFALGPRVRLGCRLRIAGPIRVKSV